MSHDHGGRERAKSTVETNGHLNTNPTSQGDQSEGRLMATPTVEETRENPGDMNVESNQNFEMSSKTSVTPPREPYTRPRTNVQVIASTESATLLEPPVTKKTLSELDVNKIVHNPKLRHDINFDPDLHFRPNLDGDKGRKKTEKTEGFYETMRTQLSQYLMNREQFEKDIGESSEWCLPATLKAIRGILETLVPHRDRDSVEETFNVDLLMQQFRKGVADLPRLAQWLSQLLKCHCAPMRDVWVDNMVSEITQGDKEGDVALLVHGMRNILGVLEAMKLDVANHQIRCLRPLLIDDTVHFEQKFFMKKIAAGRVDIAGANAWFRRASSLPEMGDLPEQPRGNFSDFWDFIKALVTLTLQSRADEMVPHTFLFDEERLIKLRTDIEDQINLDICMHMFRGLEANTRMQEARSMAQMAQMAHDDTPYTSAPCSRSPSPANSYSADNSVPSSPYLVPVENLEMHHFTQKPNRPGYFKRDASGKIWVPTHPESISCPRSSPSSTSSTPGSYLSQTPNYLSLPLIDTAALARSSLIAILASSNAPNKWSTLGPELALEVLRCTKTPLTYLPQFEQHLALHLSDTKSRVYLEAEQRVLAQIFPVLRNLVDKYTPMTSVQIFEAATTSAATSKSRSSNPQGQKEEIEEIATRIAHIGTLHWRVWAPLAYLVPGVEGEGDQGEEMLLEHIQKRAASMP